MNQILLQGCTFQPLASYLKALAIFRLVATQADTNATGEWTDSGFELTTALDREALVNFFLTRYSPSPILAPWNGGSGFYEKDRKVGMDAILNSKDPRFEQYKSALTTATDIVTRVGSQKGAAKSDEDKRRESILIECRNTLPDACVEWLDAAIAVSAEGKRAFAPILGTGGNDGRLDYTNNFMENVTGLLLSPSPKTPVRALLENALFDNATIGLQDLAVGQYDPGRTGGFNQGQGIDSGSVVNPWNAVFTLEGAISWVGGIYKKQGTANRSYLCSPFTVRHSPVGHGSSAEAESDSARAEIWTPLWDRSATWPEIKCLFREARAALDGKPAGNGLQFAEAIASLSVDRGISSFIRYGILMRRGLSYSAQPLGAFAVRYNSHSDLIRQLPRLLDDAESAMRQAQKEAPASWKRLRRNVEDAMINALLKDSNETLENAARALGAALQWFCKSGLKFGDFFGRLSEGWIESCQVASSEANVAAALASLPGIEENLLSSSKLYSWTGRDLADRMLATVRRRVLSEKTLTSPFAGISASPVALQQFLDGELDDSKLEDLFFAFVRTKPTRLRAANSEKTRLWPVFCAMKLLFLSSGIPSGDLEVLLAPDLAIPTLLSANRTSEAAAAAVRRLTIAGLHPMQMEYGDVADSRRLGAALLIPFNHPTLLQREVAENQNDL